MRSSHTVAPVKLVGSPLRAGYARANASGERQWAELVQTPSPSASVSKPGDLDYVKLVEASEQTNRFSKEKGSSPSITEELSFLSSLAPSAQHQCAYFTPKQLTEC